LKDESLRIVVGDKDDREDAPSRPVELPAGTYDWKKLEGTFQVPSQRHSIVLRIVSADTGEAWLDDIEVVLTKLPARD
jgi:hypothetical protein